MARRVSGIAAVELLLIAPVFAILFFGLMTLALASRLKMELSATARAGADFAAYSLARSEDLPGIVNAAEVVAAYSNTPITVSAEQYCGCLDTGTGVLTVVSCSTGSCPAADTRPLRFVRIEAAAVHVFPWDLPGLPASWNLTSTVEARVF
ncbi:MAG: pilus assembly protein [Sinobacteraceae bacterium]|nr:pilus assembly protein [Nevskiaceae bacterium]